LAFDLLYSGQGRHLLLQYWVSHEDQTMSHAHEDQDYEIIGVVPSIAMVLGGLLVAILPALMQIYLLLNS